MASLNIYKKATGLEEVTLVGKTYDVMDGATSTTDGKVGLTPAPVKGQEDYVLTGSGLWGPRIANSDIADKTSIAAIFTEE